LTLTCAVFACAQKLPQASLSYRIEPKLHCESKRCHPNHGYNFVSSWSICKILSLLQRAVNFQQNRY